MQKGWLLAAAAVVAFPACSSGSRPASRRPARPDPGSISGRYLALATRANTTIDDAKHRLRADHPDLSDAEQELRNIAEAKRVFDRDLRALTFPPDVQPAVAALLSADAELESRLEEGARSGTAAELGSATPHILDAGAASVSAAATLRRLLGLPPLA